MPPWLADSHHPIIKDLATDNLFCGFLCIAILAFIEWCAMRLKLDTRKTTIISALVIMALLIVTAIVMRSAITAVALIKHSMPFLAAMAWATSALSFRKRVNESIATQSKMIHDMKTEMTRQGHELNQLRPGNVLDGVFVKRRNGSIYKIEGGLLRYIQNEDLFYKSGFSQEDAVCLPESIISKIPVGENLTHI